jgi:hypothetical protein
LVIIQFWNKRPAKPGNRRLSEANLIDFILE